MKLELEISDDLHRRITHSAAVFNKTQDDYLRDLLNERVMRIPDPEGAKRRIEAIRATATPDDGFDDELLEALRRNRGQDWQAPTDANGQLNR